MSSAASLRDFGVKHLPDPVIEVLKSVNGPFRSDDKGLFRDSPGVPVVEPSGIYFTNVRDPKTRVHTLVVTIMNCIPANLHMVFDPKHNYASSMVKSFYFSEKKATDDKNENDFAGALVKHLIFTQSLTELQTTIGKSIEAYRRTLPPAPAPQVGVKPPKSEPYVPTDSERKAFDELIIERNKLEVEPPRPSRRHAAAAAGGASGKK